MRNPSWFETGSQRVGPYVWKLPMRNPSLAAAWWAYLEDPGLEATYEESKRRHTPLGGLLASSLEATYEESKPLADQLLPLPGLRLEATYEESKQASELLAPHHARASLEATYEESKHDEGHFRRLQHPPVWKLPMRNPSVTAGWALSAQNSVWKLPMRNPSRFPGFRSR